ncbi:MAG: AbrB/MazE/SpoVT family DNA-binding domain-containing protein [Castellaniella sp.]|nr:AbrB/MazE/SpoVT family DNA-binding domain-containing protein [Castellaniella sp.]
MRTVSVFRNNKNQAVRIPRDLEFQEVSEVEIIPQGNALLLRPCRPSWTSLRNTSAAGDSFLANRPDTIEENGPFGEDT